MLAIQKLKSEANVNDAVTANIRAAGDLDNKFRTMDLGADADEKLKKHADALQTAREGFRAGLNSDYERKLYDQETMRRFGYDVVNASNYAAQQFKQYGKRSAEANQLALIENAIKDPKTLDDAVNGTIRTESEQSVSDADSADLTALRNKQKVGRLIKQFTASRAERNPEEATGYLEKFHPNMLETDYQEAKKTIEDKSAQYYSTLDARAVTTRIPGGHPASLAAGEISRIAEANNWVTFTPDAIYRLVQQESPEGNAPPNKYGYAGWFQMRPSEVGSTPAQFAKMSFEQQLNLYATKYLPSHGYTGTEDLGVMNAAPAFKDSPDTAIAYKAGSPEALANPQWVKYSASGGAVTVGGIKAWLAAGGSQDATPEASLPELLRRGEDLAQKRFPNNPIVQAKYIEQFDSKIVRNSNLARKELNDQIRTERMSVDSVLQSKSVNDRGPTSFEEAARVDPTFQDKVNEAAKRNPMIYKHVLDTFNYNAKLDVPPTPERNARFDAFWKLSAGLNPGDRDQFLHTSPASLDLTHAQTEKINFKQTEMNTQDMKAQAKATDTWRLNGSLHTLSGLLSENKIYNNTKDPKKQAVYNQFVGGLMQRLDDWKGDPKNKGKAWPTDQEVFEMAAPLLKRDAGPWYSLGPGKPSFQVPDDKRQEIIKNFKERYNGREPNSIEIGTIWQRMQNAH
jgi:hypothetical protein